MNIEKSHKGFTLAEVLLTLSVIGVVAAMTIPTLINKANNSEVSVKVKKYQGVLQSAVTAIMAEKSLSGFDNVYTDKNEFWNDFKSKLNIIKECGTASGAGCFAPGVTYKYLNGTDDTLMDNSAAFIKAILSDGASISVGTWVAGCNGNNSISGTGVLTTKCEAIAVDINGHKGPNQSGRDFFYWRVYKDGRVIPVGTDDDNNKGCDAASTDITQGSDGAAGTGSGCTAKILTESTINY